MPPHKWNGPFTSLQSYGILFHHSLCCCFVLCQYEMTLLSSCNQVTVTCIFCNYLEKALGDT